MKRFLTVKARFHADGSMLPLIIIRDNGAEYPNSNVIGVKFYPTVMAVKGGVKFTCVILGKIRELYFEEQRWYIIKKAPDCSGARFYSFGFPIARSCLVGNEKNLSEQKKVSPTASRI